MAKLMAEALSGMNIDRAFIVHGLNGWDEPTPVGEFELYDVKPNHVQRMIRDPKDFGIVRCTEDDLKGGDATTNAKALMNVFNQKDQGPHRDALILGTGLALEVSNTVSNLKEGIELAKSIIDEGTAAQMINSLKTP
jgi:anthranilate phosphoribosyltransferase